MPSESLVTKDIYKITKVFMCRHLPGLASIFARKELNEHGVNQVFEDEFNKRIKSFTLEELVQQKFNVWINFLKTSNHPNWFKLFLAAKIRSLGSFDKPRETFTTRSQSTNCYAPELNVEAINFIYDSLVLMMQILSKEIQTFIDKRVSMLDIMEKHMLKNRVDCRASDYFTCMQNLDFAKLYAFALIEASQAIDQSPIGYVYKLYNTGQENYLEGDIRGYGTGLCISSGSASNYLEGGKSVVVIFTKERFGGLLTRPRVAIAFDSSGKAIETKGIDLNQKVEPCMQEIVGQVKSQLTKGIEPQPVCRTTKEYRSNFESFFEKHRIILERNSHNIIPEEVLLIFYKALFIETTNLLKNPTVKKYLSQYMIPDLHHLLNLPKDPTKFAKIKSFIPIFLEIPNFTFKDDCTNLHELFGSNVAKHKKFIQKNIALVAELLNLKPDEIVFDIKEINKKTKIFIGNIYNCNIPHANAGLVVYGHIIYFDFSNGVIKLPNDLTIFGDLDINGSSLYELPDGLTVYGATKITNTSCSKIGKVRIYNGVDIDPYGNYKITVDPEAIIVGLFSGKYSPQKV